MTEDLLVQDYKQPNVDPQIDHKQLSHIEYKSDSNINPPWLASDWMTQSSPLQWPGAGDSRPIVSPVAAGPRPDSVGPPPPHNPPTAVSYHTTPVLVSPPEQQTWWE